MKQTLPVFGLVLFIAACAQGQANHLGNPLLLPVAVVSNGLQNASYNARRAKVDGFVQSNHPALIRDISNGHGPHLSMAIKLAQVQPQSQTALIKELRTRITFYRSNPDAVTVTLMVHGP